MQSRIHVRDDIKKHLAKYERIRVLIENDESSYNNDTFCLTLPNEPPNAKNIRKELLKRSFKNITNDLLSATKDAIFHEGPRLEFKDKNNPLAKWTENVTLGGDEVSLKTYAADTVVYGLRGYGHVWTVIDKPSGEFDNFEKEMEFGAPYLSNIYPGNVVNYELINGELIWFAYNYPYHEPWTNPLEAPPPYNGKDELRIWTRDQFIRIRDDKATPVVMDHNFGFVPVVYQSFITPPDEVSIIGIAPFFTSSSMIIYANNMQSVADMELFKHGSSVLLVQEDSVNSLNQEIDEEGVPKTKLQDAAGYNKYVFSGEVPPQYLTKDLAAVDKANRQAENYFLAAIQNERTLQSIYKKRDTVRESGETKVYDAEPTNAGLRATSQDLELWTRKILNMVARMLNRENLVDSFVNEYPDRYIIGKTAEEKFKRIEYMIKTKYPSETGMKESYKALTPEIAHDNKQRELINQEIEAADINVDYDAEIEDELKKEQEFEDSIKDMKDEEKKEARAKRKFNSEGVE